MEGDAFVRRSVPFAIRTKYFTPGYTFDTCCTRVIGADVSGLFANGVSSACVPVDVMLLKPLVPCSGAPSACDVALEASPATSWSSYTTRRVE